MVTMGRPRERDKDLPVGLYRDGAGRITLKVFTADMRAKLGGKSSMSFGRDLKAARLKWAEVYGFRDLEPAGAGSVAEIIDRFLTDELPRMVMVRGEPRPKYAPRTQREYRRQADHLRVRFGAMRYAKSEAEAARGDFIRTMHVQQFIREGELSRAHAANRDAAVLSTMFRWAKGVGLTEYNPCLGAERNVEVPRETMPDDELFLALWEEADPFLRIWMDFGHMIGSRIGDILKTMESDAVADGINAIPGKVKRGQARRKQLFRWTDDLRAAWEAARALKRSRMAAVARQKGCQPIASVYLLPNPRTGEPYTLSGFEGKWDRARVRLARKRLGTDATPDQVRQFVRDLDVHMHDGRARSADDAEKRGEDVADFLGHTTDATSRRHYLNRSVKVLTPNPRIRGKAA